MMLEGVGSVSEANEQREQILQNIRVDATRQQAQMSLEKAERHRRLDLLMSRQQLETTAFQTQRALANEHSNRVLSSMFSKFSLIQKIIQGMG
ncbi:hypothetical protein [Epibacterium ulvae]|uniref:hypothetical protein n=1 Tax=Epibacterium ulvae TaxID=1156985 RepID=UPI0011132F41|nr:hypothetical protein [Epibacterium ulvae]